MRTNRSDAPDSELWSLVCAGDGSAFGILFDRHRDTVFRSALRVVDTAHEAEDVTAMVFLETWRHRDRVRFLHGSMAGWLLATTTNVARNSLRSKLRYRRLTRNLPPPSHSPDHADAVLDKLDRAQSRATIQASFMRLSHQDRQVLTLCVVDNLSVRDAAYLLGIPAGTVKSRLSRAKRKFARELERRGQAPTNSVIRAGGTP
jgi:RNA polymerase sigma factor (sigma-70 family)